MFNTKTATINNEEFNSSYMPVGINESVVLKEVNVKTSPTGKNFIEIIFEDGSGRTASMSEWKNEKNMWIKTDEDLQNRDNVQFGRLMQIINCYYDTIEDVTLNTFGDMINWVKSKLDSVTEKEKKPLRLKVVYDKKGYTTISSNGIFVEPMSVEKSQVKLFKRDLLERPVQADVETPADPLASNTSTPEPFADSDTQSNVLPF